MNIDLGFIVATALHLKKSFPELTADHITDLIIKKIEAEASK